MPQFEAKTCSLRCLLRSWSFPACLSIQHVRHAQQPGWVMRCKIHQAETPALLWI